MEQQVLLNPEGPLDQGYVLNQGGNSILASSATSVVQLPAKKPTRQWAAWTHQEEESFFTALRQVGKNFEKITSRVQSKNKDQVRHYYYRLVRRMNKLLGPELSLDAKNPKDTNAAMLRWWSLLEKYSCKASKLHLKPRRFKLFIEALEHQLLKDRRKTIRKRACQGENFSTASLGNMSSQNRERGVESHTFKLILVDSQNISKLGPGRASTRHSKTLGVSHGDEKEDTNGGRGAKQRRRRAGVSSPAMYRRWERAAMDGVSLVADAAEHLERTTIDKAFDCQKGPKSHHPVGKSPLSFGSSDQNHLSGSKMQSATKLKLQLFPIDDGTRRALEMENHNPHLELTLSNRKKISSVLEHLNRKWGNSSAASGELMLLPYSARKESVMYHQRWTQDSFLSAADVHSMVGNPSVFRLRYGWFIHGALVSALCPPVEHDMNVDDANGHVNSSAPLPIPSTSEQSDIPVEPNQSLVSLSGESHGCGVKAGDNLEGPVSASTVPWNRKEMGNMPSSGYFENADDLHLSSGNTLSAGEWADSLTNISVGDLLSEAPDNIDNDCVDPPAAELGHGLLENASFVSDSFDAAIAAHILRQQSKSGIAPTLASHSPSLWDDEETRDAFSFQKNRVADVHASADVASSRGISRANAEPSQMFETQVIPSAKGASESPDHEDPMDEDPTEMHTLDSSGKTYCGIADVYWADSLGPLDMDIRSWKYKNEEDLIISDSLGDLSRLIASSLDAFQNCSLFGFDSKKDQQPSIV